jgi:2'-5' RNA ligase
VANAGAFNVTIHEPGWRQTGVMAGGNWFLALVVPEQAALLAATAGLPPGLRRFQPADLHLTLAFLGACGEDRALRAWQAIAPIGHPPIRACAGAWRAMGPPRRPSAYALTLGRGRRLTARLIESCRAAALAGAELPCDDRPPLPHITLARPRLRAVGATDSREAMAAWLRHAPVPGQPFTLEEIGLYRWAEDRGQRLFSIALRRPLDQPAISSAQSSIRASGTGLGR